VQEAMAERKNQIQILYKNAFPYISMYKHICCVVRNTLQIMLLQGVMMSLKVDGNEKLGGTGRGQ
jgi:hypothetical protein